MNSSVHKKNFWIAMALAALGLLAALAFGTFQPSRSDSPEVLNTTLAALNIYPSAMVVAADQSQSIEQGTDCFKDAGLRPTIIKRSKGPDIVDALMSGSADFGTLALTPQALQALQGSQLVIFATLQTSDEDIKVVGRRSAGITGGASLKGKRIGFVGGTYGEIFLSRYLEKYGLKRDDVRLTSAPPAQLRDLFLNKSIDAIVIWEPFIQDILSDPGVDRSDVFVDVDRSLYLSRINLVARPEVLKAKTEEARRLVRAMACGEEMIRKHPNSVQKNLEVWLDRNPGTLNGVFHEADFRLRLDVPNILKDLKGEAEWAREAVFNNKVSVPQDFKPYVDSSIMQAVEPTKVQE